MLKAVVDTNVIISAAISETGKPFEIMKLVLSKKVCLFYSREIMDEYIEVLSRPHFNFNSEKQDYYLNGIRFAGELISPLKSTIPFHDESDRIFYDAAKECGAILITGNTKHYPEEGFIVTPAEFLRIYSK